MKRVLVILVSVLLLVGVAFGCSSKSAAYDSAKYEYAYEPAAEYEPVPAEYGESKNGFSGSAEMPTSASNALANRKIIRNADVTVQTLTFDAFLEDLNAAVGAIGGYIESSNVDGRTLNNSSRLRSAYFTIRIPAEQLDGFLNTVSGLGNVTSKNTSLRDVTTNYVDSEKHLESLRVEQEALMEILKQATTVEDIITVQDRLTYVRYEIESYESILRTYDDQIDLSTVSLSVREVERETPVEEESFGQEVSRRFKESMEDVGEGFRNFGAWLFGNAPEIIVTLLILGAIAFVIVLIVRLSIRGHRRRAAKKAARKAEEASK